MEPHDMLVAMGGPIKVLENEPGTDPNFKTIGGYSISFGNPGRRDHYKQFFTKDTYLGAHKGDGMDTYLQHGYALRSKQTTTQESAVLDKYAGRRIAAPTRTVVDDVGVLAKTIVDMRDEYEAMMYEMAGAGKLSYSSGALAHRFVVDDDGAIREWIIGEHSLTPTPAEWRATNLVLPVRSFITELSGEPMEERPSGLVVFPGSDIPAARSTDASDMPDTAAVRAALLGDGAEACATMAGVYELNQRLYWAIAGIVYGSNWDGKSALTIPQRLAMIQSYCAEFATIVGQFAAAGMAIGELSAADQGQMRAFIESTRAAAEAVKAGSVLNKKNTADLTSARDLIDGVLAAAAPNDATASIADGAVTTVRIADGTIQTGAERQYAELVTLVGGLATKLDDHVRQYNADERERILSSVLATTTTDDTPPSPTKTVVSPALLSASLRRVSIGNS